jgi:tRNA pseudouridine55 synthase
VTGVLVLDKPAGMSSASAVDRVKRELGASRAGHGGTLDPIATGVLPICLGEATKIASYLLADDKEYEATATLGIETDTLDRTGTVTATYPVVVDAGAIERALAEQDQIPPMYSAIKQGGVRLYHHARAGAEVAREPRRITITRLELLELALPRVRIAIACSKGTYVRSVIDDLGRDLGCGAHMAELRRTRSGVFTLDRAQPIDALDPARLIGMVEATSLPVVAVGPELVGRVRSGVQLPPAALAIDPENYERFQIVEQGHRLVAIAHVERERVVYDRVFAA